MTSVGAVLGRESTVRGRATRPLIIGVGVVIVAGILQTVGRSKDSFPRGWYAHLADPVNDFQGWVRDNRLSHPLFTYFFDPISNSIDQALRSVNSFFIWLPWYVIPAVVFLAIARPGWYRTAAMAGVAALYPGAVGLWPQSMDTLSLMTVSVLLSVLLGVPLGVLAALSVRFERAMRPVLDAMQTVPATVYLIPVVLFFGIGRVPAAIATVIYALPPVTRLTTLGIRQVPAATVEAGRVFGSTRRQLLTKVQLPLALRSIVAGVNQTIMMALGIVVIASLVGAGGLGQEVLQTLQIRSPGRGFVVGFAIVAIAMVLDRVSRSFAERAAPVASSEADAGGGPLTRAARTGPLRSHRLGALVALAVVAATIVGRIAGWTAFPLHWNSSFADPIDSFVIWIRDHFDVVTRPLNDFLVRDVLVKTREFLTASVAWPVLVLGTAALCWWAGGRALAMFAAAGLTLIGLVGMWVFAIDTLTQTMMAVVGSLAIAIPVGIWAGRAPRVEKVLSPVLDALQTIPSLIYAIPFVMIFTVSPIPGVLASVLYAIPPGIRITALGIKGVQGEAIEAATTFGATKHQVLWGVRVPLALPTIMMAVNQVIMMVLSMVIIAGMVGGGALGFKAVEALTRTDTGLGVEVGIAVVVMAMLLDRFTQAVAERFQPPAATS